MNNEISTASKVNVEEVEEKFHLNDLDFPLDENGAVKWLLSQGCLPQEAAMSENAEKFLPTLMRTHDMPVEELDFSAVDWPYKPEYDKFMAAVERLPSKEEPCSSLPSLVRSTPDKHG